MSNHELHVMKFRIFPNQLYAAYNIFLNSNFFRLNSYTHSQDQNFAVKLATVLNDILKSIINTSN